MSNQALPRASADLLATRLNDCRNLSLILDKFVPWAQDQRGNWDVTAKVKPPNKKRDAGYKSGGEAKGHWLKTGQKVYSDESDTVFIQASNDSLIPRVDEALMQAKKARWVNLVKANNGLAFHMKLSERMVAGLGASHVLETGLTLDRNTGLPYLPGSTVKGLARAWGLIEVASQFGIKLDDKVKVEGEKEPISALNALSDMLVLDTNTEKSAKKYAMYLNVLGQAFSTERLNDIETHVDDFRFIFGSQGNAGAISFLDAIYSGDGAPSFAADVMTPHYVKYYTTDGKNAPAEDDNPNPVSFLTVDKGNRFAFGLLPNIIAFEKRNVSLTDGLNFVGDWLTNALAKLGAGSKTASGYGFFRAKSKELIVGGK